jgi:hypothetical protein
MLPALLPLFAPSCAHVGWLKPEAFVFDLDMTPLAFVVAGNAWSLGTAAWLGPIVDGHLYDLDGLPVAWSPEKPLRRLGTPFRPQAMMRPTRPVRPVRPVQPRRPLGAPTVIGGWSRLAFAEWLVFSDPVPEPPRDATTEPDEASGGTPAAPERNVLPPDADSSAVVK